MYIFILRLETTFRAVRYEKTSYVVSTMPVFQCPIEGCAFQTDDVDTAVAAVLRIIHNNVHLSTPVPSNAGSHHRAPKLKRQNQMKRGTPSKQDGVCSNAIRGSLTQESFEQLFYCCHKDLGDAILKGHQYAVIITEENLLQIIKQFTIIPVAISVRRADLLNAKPSRSRRTRQVYNGPRVVKFISSKSKKFWVKNDF